MCSVTSQGHAYARFRRALDTRNATIALAAASEMPHVGLVDALELVLLLTESEPVRFERAALRWHARYCAETRDVPLIEAGAVLALLASLCGPRATSSARALAELLDHRGLERAAEVLIAWANARP
jgi:hypothetical protein